MDKTQSTLTETEISQIIALIESLDRSSLDFVQIDSAGMKVTIGKGNVALPALSNAQPGPAPAPVAQAPAQQPASGNDVSPAAPDAGGHVITAPMMGRFYSRPDPASPPFVTVGSEVDINTSVGLIEVMKLFNTVQSDIAGIITEICVPDGEFIEYGAPLFKLQPIGKQSGR